MKTQGDTEIPVDFGFPGASLTHCHRRSWQASQKTYIRVHALSGAGQVQVLLSLRLQRRSVIYCFPTGAPLFLEGGGGYC